MARLIARLPWAQSSPPEAQAEGLEAWLIPARWDPEAGLVIATPPDALAPRPFAMEWHISGPLSPAQEHAAASALRPWVVHPQALRIADRPTLWIHDPEWLSHAHFSPRRLRALVHPELLLLAAGPAECAAFEGSYERTERIPLQHLPDGELNYESYLFHAHHRPVGPCRWAVPAVHPPGAKGFAHGTAVNHHEWLALSEAWAELHSESATDAWVLVEEPAQHLALKSRGRSTLEPVPAPPPCRPADIHQWGEAHPHHPALLIHGYHQNLLERWLQPLAPGERGAMPVDLYVSCPREQVQATETLLRRQGWPRVVLVGVDNRGRDLAPFLSELLPRALAQGHPWLVKLHTKRSAQTPHGERWGEHLWSSLASPEGLRLVEAKLGAAGPSALLAPAGSVLPMSVCLARNARHLKALLRATGLTGRWFLGQRFVAGSMWAARSDSLLELLDLTPEPDAFEVETGQIDGTLAHAWERLLAPLLATRGCKIVELDGDSSACPPFGHPWAAVVQQEAAGMQVHTRTSNRVGTR